MATCMIGKIPATKKLLNSPLTCVNECINGFLSWNPGLVGLPGYHNVVMRRDWMERAKEGKVAIVTGGGSGHEPCFVGFVGQGMATAAVQGHLFAAPSSHSILETLMTFGKVNKGGILVIFNNYTGDRLNFGIASEKARSKGVNLEVVVNGDDCAINEGAKPSSRRGLSGLILLLKIVGHMADSGDSLENIAICARQLLPTIATMGVAWTPCSLPGGGPLFELGHDEMEIGLGMHGEAGIKRIKMSNTKDTVSLLLAHMLKKDVPSPFLNIKEGDRIVVLLNNMGSTSDIEMNIFAKEVIVQLEEYEDVTMEKMYVGRYVTSQEMAGISITIMITDHIIEEYLDSPSNALSWVTPVSLHGFKTPHFSQSDDDDLGEFKDDDNDYGKGPSLTTVGHAILVKSLTSIANTLIANEILLNTWDTISGDGDCGSTFASGARGIFKILQTGVFNEMRNCCYILETLAGMVETTMGGTSGGLYSLFLTSVSQEFSSEPSNNPLTSELCVRAIRRGINTIMKYGGSAPGDRTMIDPLNSACQYLEIHVDTMDTVSLWQQALKVAEQEMRQTKEMIPKAGRASYVNPALMIHPDPGAKAFCLWLTAVVNTLIDNKKYL